MINLILTITLLFCSLLAKAQGQFEVQVPAIVSNACITNEEDNNSNKKLYLGCTAGVFSELSVSDRVNLKPSLNFMPKGINYSNEF